MDTDTHPTGANEMKYRVNIQTATNVASHTVIAEHRDIAMVEAAMALGISPDRVTRISVYGPHRSLSLTGTLARAYVRI